MMSSLSCPLSRNSRRSVSGMPSSSKMGSDTTYFSAAHAPRSVIRQRSEQNGKSASVAESVDFLQMGQWCFIVKEMFYHPEGIRTSAENVCDRWWLKIEERERQVELLGAGKGARPVKPFGTGERRPPRKTAATKARRRHKAAPTNALG